MNLPESNEQFDELEALILEAEDGTLDDVGVARLQELLRGSEEARARYVQLQMLNVAMKLDGDAGLSLLEIPAELESKAATSETEMTRRPEPKSLRNLFPLVAVVVIVLLAGRLIQLEWIERSGTQPDDFAGSETVEEEPTAEGVALVTHLVDVKWEDSQVPLEIGDAVVPGRLAIAGGFAQLEFFCGATVILEGPAELELHSSLHARVRRGRLRAQVPPAARGFSLEVDDMKVVDLGTEFGLAVTEDGASVQVFDGEVELQSPKMPKRLVRAGQGVERKPDGSIQDASVTPERFLDIATLATQSESQQTARYERWKTWSGQLRRDPRLITWHAFAESAGWERRLRCDLLPEYRELDGAIVGASQVPGRWPAKRALEFKQPGDRVRVQIPGEFDSLTFAAWVKIDSLDRQFNSLFLTDNYNKGEPHWQILESGQLYFSVRPREVGEEGPHDFKALSPPFWKPSLSGRWLHLATVYSVPAGTITHYLNGKKLSGHAVPEAKLVQTTRIGTACIGNWSAPTRPDSSFAIRNINGSIDEFALFAVALTADEILKIYENGKP